MLNRLRLIHIYLGLAVSLPVLAWSVSGFFLALPPGAISGEPYNVVETHRIKVTAEEALEAVQKFSGQEPKATSIGLEQRGETIRYSIFGKGGSFRVNAVTGVVSKPPPTPHKTKLIRHAHFFNFSGAWRTSLLLLFSSLTALSTLSGLVLLVFYFRRRFQR